MHSKEPWNNTIDTHPLIEVVVDRMGWTTMEVVAGEEDEPLKTSLYVNFLGRVDMLSKSVIIDLISPFKKLILHNMFQETHQAALISYQCAIRWHVSYDSHSAWVRWWYYRFPDSGARNHVINDLGNLSISFEYNGNGKIHMGNGTGLSISHIGNKSFRSNSRVLHHFSVRACQLGKLHK